MMIKPTIEIDEGMETAEITLPAGFIVKIDGIPVRLYFPTSVATHKDNVPLMRSLETNGVFIPECGPHIVGG